MKCFYCQNDMGINAGVWDCNKCGLTINTLNMSKKDRDEIEIEGELYEV